MTEELRHKLFKEKPLKEEPDFKEARIIGAKEETEEDIVLNIYFSQMLNEQTSQYLC